MRFLSTLFCLSSRQFDGERDTRNPNDFTNGSDSKLDDILEGDDDDDEPEPIPARGSVGTKKSGDAKAKVDAGVKAKQGASKGVVSTPDVSTSYSLMLLLFTLGYHIDGPPRPSSHDDTQPPNAYVRWQFPDLWRYAKQQWVK